MSNWKSEQKKTTSRIMISRTIGDSNANPQKKKTESTRTWLTYLILRLYNTQRFLWCLRARGHLKKLWSTPTASNCIQEAINDYNVRQLHIFRIWFLSGLQMEILRDHCCNWHPIKVRGQWCSCRQFDWYRYWLVNDCSKIGQSAIHLHLVNGNKTAVP